MQTVEEPFHMETTSTSTEIDDNSTKMTLRNKGHPISFSKLFAPFIPKMIRKAINEDLTNMKKILETT